MSCDIASVCPIASRHTGISLACTKNALHYLNFWKVHETPTATIIFLRSAVYKWNHIIHVLYSSTILSHWNIYWYQYELFTDVVFNVISSWRSIARSISWTMSETCALCCSRIWKNYGRNLQRNCKFWSTIWKIDSHYFTVMFSWYSLLPTF